MADDLENEWWLEEKVKTENSEDEKLEVDQILLQDEDSEMVKKKKRKKKLTITQELKEKGDAPSSPSDVMAALERFFEGKLSPVELDELQLSEDDHFYKQNNSSQGFAVAYLKSILPKWKKMKRDACTSPGSPVLLVLTSSALRAVQLNRQIEVFKGEDCKCAKLFAKHMKLEEQQKFLKKAVCLAGIGTPNRVLSLLKSGHLKLEKLKALVLDWNWRDVKQRRLVDVPEVRSDLFVLLQTKLIPHIKSSVSSCKIGIL
ncbi:hypothetical protein ACJMK2_028501 [Sinanodonta woodiana]|uniref:Protein CMSS1 n=1 Tax=Sinanodonta woodiana TaxID=1069815 RepID=A0ABD3XB64_SINWO